MYIFILGILVIVGSLAYIYVINNKHHFVSKKNSDSNMYDEYDFDNDNDEDEEEASPVIYLPDDIEQEKEKRKKRR
ncbi:MAG: hypothetical protein PHW03_03310 [Eubacteriales bacterium]|nr:hypothetical protein [Eubacteriales bacterium]MDD4389814.1 hypothetical protein [Eubacteriales bacterium]